MGLGALFVITERDGGSLAPREAEQKQLLQRSGHRALLQGADPLLTCTGTALHTPRSCRSHRSFASVHAVLVGLKSGVRMENLCLSC